MRAYMVAVRAAVLVLAAAAAVWAAPRYIPVFVGGASMEPALRIGDLVLVRRDAGTPRAGDIVLVSKPGWPRGVLHRVEEVMVDGSLRLRGDANEVVDRDLAQAISVRGVVCAFVPTGRMLAALERALARWYNPASQPNSGSVDGEARAPDTIVAH